MTYTTHRDTQETLQILDQLDLDTDKPTQEDIMKRFGLEEQFQTTRTYHPRGRHEEIWIGGAVPDRGA